MIAHVFDDGGLVKERGRLARRPSPYDISSVITSSPTLTLVGYAQSSLPSDPISDLIVCHDKGEVRTVAGLKGGRPYVKPLKAKNAHLLCPSFDFDYLLDCDARTPTIDRPTLIEAAHAAWSRVRAGSLTLPFPKTNFAFWLEDPKSAGRDVIQVAQVTSGEDCLKITAFDLTDGQFWFLAPVSASFKFDGLISRIWQPDHRKAASGWRKCIEDLMTMSLVRVLVATAMLADRQGKIETELVSASRVALNRSRYDEGLEPLPPTIRISLDPTVGVHSILRIRDKNGSPKAPHNRRAHLRRYKSGVVKLIHAMAIHGGSNARRTYLVE